MSTFRWGLLPVPTRQKADRSVGDGDRGAMLAVELVSDNTSKTPNATLATTVNKACHQASVVTLTAGEYGNVLVFLPPLAIDDDLLQEGLDIIEDAFAASV
jgi:4-aminobutyrate aminotransferase / (S)-3-amino-2-methylpropionate transaminase / 5-aminovalerate transaminase